MRVSQNVEMTESNEILEIKQNGQKQRSNSIRLRKPLRYLKLIPMSEIVSNTHALEIPKKLHLPTVKKSNLAGRIGGACW